MNNKIKILSQLLDLYLNTKKGNLLRYAFENIPENMSIGSTLLELSSPASFEIVEKEINVDGMNIFYIKLIDNGERLKELCDNFKKESSSTSKRIATQKILKSKYFILNLDKCHLTYAGQTVNVSPSVNEIRLLELLISHTPNVVGYAEIVRYVYNGKTVDKDLYADAKDTDTDIQTIGRDIKRNLIRYIKRNFNTITTDDSNTYGIETIAKFGLKIL